MEATPTPHDDYILQETLPLVEQALGYRFRDRRLLLTALTHRSYCHENNTASGDFDEMEWLGDSVLQLAISSWLFRSARGSRRTSGQLSKTRQRFVDAGACESFALQLNLLPYLRIGQGQPVRGTKILADCFEAVLGAVYIDAGGCSDLEPIHAILARVIPSYEHRGCPQQQQYQGTQHQTANLASQPPRPQAEDPRKLMNLAHRLTQMAKHGMDVNQVTSSGPASRSPPGTGQRNPLEVLRDFDARLRDFQERELRGGALSFGATAFSEAFGADVAHFFEVAAGDPEKRVHLDEVLAGTSMLRKSFVDAPQGAERAVMEVVPVPSEMRLQCFTVVEFLLVNVLQQCGEPDQRVLRMIQSAPDGASTIALLSNIVTETATSLLLNSRQRAAISSGLSREPTPAVTTTVPPMIHHTRGPPPPPLQPPPPMPASGGPLHPGFSPPRERIFGPGFRRDRHLRHHAWETSVAMHGGGRGWGRGRGRRHGGRRGGF